MALVDVVPALLVTVKVICPESSGRHFLMVRLCLPSVFSMKTLSERVYFIAARDHSTLGSGFPVTSVVNLASSSFSIWTLPGLVDVGTTLAPAIEITLWY